ncbi:MAG: response regulator [Rhizobacter sp.]|nr:response regulator [Bacteriovorax sp.]
MTKIYSSKKILVADDTAFLRTSLIKDLVDLGFDKGNILECENGRVAYDNLIASAEKNDHFDLILSDWNMPKLNGLEFLKLVRGSKKYFSDIPFILITTVSEKEKIVEALSYNVSSYIIKPIQLKKLQETIVRFI